MKSQFDSRRTVALAVGLAVGLSLAAAFPARAAVPFSVGDVFAAIGSSQVKHFSSTGTLLETLNDTTGSTYTAGMCFDTAGNLYVTNFSTDSISKFNNTGTLVAANYITGIATGPESCVFDSAGNQYVGTANASKIYKYSSTGTAITSYNITQDARGADWIDLSADQCTMLYTSEGTKIKRFDVCTNTQLSDFATGLTSPLYAFRILPGGGVLAAEGSQAQMLNSSGTPTATYTVAGGNTFALNRDPNGTQFWTGDLFNGNVFKYNISPSGAPVTTFNAGISTALGGLAIFGELVVSQPTPTPQGTVIPPTATRTNTPVGPAAVVPTLSFPMLGLLCAALIGAALFLMRR